jgi:hypothetical protein
MKMKRRAELASDPAPFALTAQTYFTLRIALSTRASFASKSSRFT